jgi:hypothetical protein
MNGIEVLKPLHWGAKLNSLHSILITKKVNLPELPKY